MRINRSLDSATDENDDNLLLHLAGNSMSTEELRFIDGSKPGHDAPSVVSGK